MRKILMAACLAAFSAGLPALDFSLHGGYTTLDMGELNHANASLMGYNGDGNAPAVQSGVVLGADLTQATALPWLRVGLRLETLQSNLSEIKIDGGSYCFSDQAALSDLTLGLQTSASGPAGLRIGLVGWLGYGYATLKQRDLAGGYVQSALFMGSLPVAEAEVSLAYDLGKRVHVSLNGGWRWANAGYLYDDTHQALVNNDFYFSNSTMTPINVDYSGVTGQGSVSYSF